MNALTRRLAPRLQRRLRVALLALSVGFIAAGRAGADQQVVTGNNGTLSASAQLQFEINIGKFLMLRVGAADATQSDVTFRVAVTPVIGGSPANSLSYAGAVPPGMATSSATTNPTSASGSLPVQAYTNVNGTTLSCSLGALAGATSFAIGATAGGVPGTSDIAVTNGASVQHPGASLNGCATGTTSSISALSNLSDTFVYSTSFVPTALSAGTYGNVVTYTATTP